MVNPFLSWAIKARLTTPTLILHRRPEGAASRMPALEQEQMVAEVSAGTKLTARDRAAAILVVVFAQQIEHVVPLTWDHVDVEPSKVTIALGKTVIEIPPPLDETFRELAAKAPSNTAAQPNSNWVFPGYGPGRHINAASLRERLYQLFSPQAARLGTLHELTKLAPIATIADALGYSTKTIERHARGAATTYAGYVANRH
jgi:integrase